MISSFLQLFVNTEKLNSFLSDSTHICGIDSNSLPRKVNTTIRQLTETKDNKFIDNLICDISMIRGGVMRTTIKDADDPYRWNVTNIPGFLEDIEPDILGQLDSVGFSSTKQKGKEFTFKLTDRVSGLEMLNTK